MVEMVGVRQVMCFVMLDSAKDLVIGADTPGQLVPPRVWYESTCLLIMDAMRSVSCLNEWELDIGTRPGSHGARGVMVPRVPQKTLALLWYCDYLS
jgi:hypothetical protein